MWDKERRAEEGDGDGRGREKRGRATRSDRSPVSGLASAFPLHSQSPGPQL